MENLAIQSNKDNIVRVEEFISRFCDTKNIPNYYATISMSVLQAVENAIVHGNESNSSKKVIIEAGDCRGGVYFVVKDEGQGFDWSSYGNLPAEGDKGDGIFLMRMLSDNLSYEDGGRTVKMEFVVRGIDESHSTGRQNNLQRFFAKKKEIV